MAYDMKNLTPIANNAKTGVVPALWMYWNEGGDTMTTAGLIKSHALSLRDQVDVISADGASSVRYYVSAKDGENITLKASA